MRWAIGLIAKHPGCVATITVDNGSEFHSYAMSRR